MVNPIEIASIPLEGRGFVHRPVGNYKAGEYKRLVNMELTDEGVLRKRNPVEIGFDRYVLPEGRFIGHLEEWIVFALNDGTDGLHFARRDNPDSVNVNPIWQGVGDNLYGSGFDPVTEGHEIVGFFRYNGRNYWLSISNNYTGTTDTYKFYLHNFASGTSEDVTVLPLVFQHDIPTVHTLLFTVAVDNHGMFGVQSFEFKKFFWFKDRLWIITNRGVYFSKATDPTNFTAPDGGFFKFPDDLVKDAVAHHDRIYVMGADDLSYITYTSDPNADASVVSIARGVGGDALVLHEDTVYMARVDQLYMVEPNRVTKVLDLDLGLASGADIKLVSFFDYVILCSRTGAGPFLGGVGSRALAPAWGAATNAINNIPYYCNNYFINMKNGCVSEFIYHTKVAGFNPADASTVHQPIDWYIMPFETIEWGDYYYAWFQTSEPDDGFGPKAGVFTLKTTTRDTISEDKGYDFAWKADGVTKHWQNIPILVEIDSYSPDGAELWMKRFRHLVLEGEVPFAIDLATDNEVRCGFAYDNQNFSQMLEFDVPNGYNESNVRLPVPFRLPMNQRARSVSIRFLQELLHSDALANPTGANAQRFEIVRLSVFWNNTNRAPVSRAGS